MNNRQFPYEIRWAHAEEWDAAMQLAWRTFMRFEAKDYSNEGIRNFKDFISGRELYRSFIKGKYQMMVALDKQKIIGMISVRNETHISLLFVDEQYHKQGVGRQMLLAMGKYIKEEVGEEFLTVRAAPYAVGFYHKLGFFDTCFEQEVGGIRATPMKLILS